MMPMVDFGVGDLNLNIEIKVEFDKNFMNDKGKAVDKNLSKALKRVANRAYLYWESEAGKRLKSARRDYQKALSFGIISDKEVHILLSGAGLVGKKNTYVLAVEMGGKAFDMKPGFLASPHTNKKKIPRAVADILSKWKWARPQNKWLVIPLNVDRQVVFSSPRVFRTVHDNLPSEAYKHPGWKGVRIADSVVKEILENILPSELEDITKNELT